MFGNKSLKKRIEQLEADLAVSRATNLALSKRNHCVDIVTKGKSIAFRFMCGDEMFDIETVSLWGSQPTLWRKVLGLEEVE